MEKVDYKKSNPQLISLELSFEYRNLVLQII